MGTALLHKIPEGHIKDNIYAFGRIPSWTQVFLACPVGYVHSKRNALMYRTSHSVNLTDGLENKLN